MGFEKGIIMVEKHGRELLNDPILNRGTAFTLVEREQLGLRGLLPVAEETLQQQFDRVIRNCAAKTTDLERYIFLMACFSASACISLRRFPRR